ncbi:MAG: N-acetyl-gamma-glutamyl-phosphate reductase [Elusimicrobia bacterium]|nr:N-acetyl-gamma-glutamyl-phosphate reductase [Elusimicrobiota bacterium]
MVKVSVAGVRGFTGEELLRILSRHPFVEIKHLFSREKGLRVGDIYPWFKSEILTENISAKAIGDTDVVFLCLPHTESAPVAAKFLSAGKRVVDLSADFRLKSAADYKNVYGVRHPCPSYLAKAVYGLTEFRRDELKDAQLVANPGCYPTAVLIAVLPAVIKGLATATDIIADAKSGVSGAGRKLSNELLFSNVYENARAYQVARHRHRSEIEQEIFLVSGRRPVLTFVPHLIPQKRGIIATVYLKTKARVKDDFAAAVYGKFYRGEKFVSVLPAGRQPATAEVIGTNDVRLGVAVDARSNILIVTSVIDNLIKGASGQAVQNMNIMFGFDEAAGLA